jgi:hypothetical protein
VLFVVGSVPGGAIQKAYSGNGRHSTTCMFRIGTSIQFCQIHSRKVVRIAPDEGQDPLGLSKSSGGREIRVVNHALSFQFSHLTVL